MLSKGSIEAREVVTVNCEHVLQGETTLISRVTGISNVNDEDDVFFGAGGANDGN